MFFNARMAILALMSLPLAPALLAGSAFEQTKRQADGRYIVDNLLIGCTTDPAQQININDHYMPTGRHDHSGKEWVSYDRNPDLLPDINEDVRDIERVIGVITTQVYVEHFNDESVVSETYQAQLVASLYKIMKPGAKLYMDYYPQAMATDDKKKYVYDMDAYPAEYGENAARNPFWTLASFAHFKAAAKKGSLLDTFGGRKAILESYVWVLKGDAEFMAAMPSRYATTAQKEAGLLEVANTMLDERLKKRGPAFFFSELQLFYGARNAEKVKSYLSQLGFKPVLIMNAGINKFNGRRGEAMIVAVKPLDEASSSAAQASKSVSSSDPNLE